MNKARRKQIAELTSQLETIRAQIELLQEEEQEAFDNLPEGIQQGERGEAMEAAAEALGNSCDDVDSVLAALAEATGEA